MIVICILVSKLLEGRDNLMHIVFSTQGPYFFFFKRRFSKKLFRADFMEFFSYLLPYFMWNFIHYYNIILMNDTDCVPSMLGHLARILRIPGGRVQSLPDQF